MGCVDVYKKKVLDWDCRASSPYERESPSVCAGRKLYFAQEEDAPLAQEGDPLPVQEHLLVQDDDVLLVQGDPPAPAKYCCA